MIKKINKNTNLITSLDILNSNKLLSCFISHQPGHPKIPRPNIPNELIPIAIVHDRHVHAGTHRHRGSIHCTLYVCVYIYVNQNKQPKKKEKRNWNTPNSHIIIWWEQRRARSRSGRRWRWWRGEVWTVGLWWVDKGDWWWDFAREKFTCPTEFSLWIYFFFLVEGLLERRKKLVKSWLWNWDVQVSLCHPPELYGHRDTVCFCSFSL